MLLNFHDPELSQKLKPKIVNTENGIVEYAEFGNGPAVLCIHGAMGGYDQSIILAQTISQEGYQFIAITRPGYLGTPIGSGKTPSEQGNLIAALMDQLGIDSAGILAVSGGGPAALKFALSYPQRCKGLVLASTNSEISENKIPFAFNIMKLLARNSWFVKKIKSKAEQDLTTIAKRSIDNPKILTQTINDEEIWPLFSTMLLSTYHRMGERIVGTDNDIKISKTTTYPLEELKAPILVIHGKQDKLVNYKTHAVSYQNRVPQLELLTIDEGEHVAIFTHRNLIRKKVSEFMEKNFQ